MAPLILIQAFDWYPIWPHITSYMGCRGYCCRFGSFLWTPLVVFSFSLYGIVRQRAFIPRWWTSPNSLVDYWRISSKPAPEKVSRSLSPIRYRIIIGIIWFRYPFRYSFFLVSCTRLKYNPLVRPSIGPSIKLHFFGVYSWLYIALLSLPKNIALFGQRPQMAHVL